MQYEVLKREFGRDGPRVVFELDGKIFEYFVSYGRCSEINLLIGADPDKEYEPEDYKGYLDLGESEYIINFMDEIGVFGEHNIEIWEDFILGYFTKIYCILKYGFPLRTKSAVSSFTERDLSE